MLKKVTAYSGDYQYVLDMGASESSGALIYDITGIAEHSKEITVDKLADRTVISSISVKQRIITLSIRIMATDVEAERRDLKRVFAEGNRVTLKFETDHLDLVSIEGTVESCNNPIFVRESIMTVTVICPRSNFLEEFQTFSVPSSNPLFTNPGNVNSDCSILIPLTVGMTTGTVTISNSLSGTAMALSVEKIVQLAGDIAEGDAIEINSGIKKSCRLNREPPNTSVNIFPAVVIPYTWIHIKEGVNALVVTGVDSTPTITYQPAHGGL